MLKDRRPLRTPLGLPADLIARKVGAMPGAALLEGGAGFGDAGRWSILAARPVLTHETIGQRLRLGNPMRPAPHVGRWNESSDVLANLIRMLLLMHSAGAVEQRGDGNDDDPPFLGGLIGYLGYDLAPLIERLPRKAPHEGGFPESWFGLYDTFVAIDHRSGGANLWAITARGSRSAAEDRTAAWLTELSAPPARLPRSRIETADASNFTAEDYRKAVARTIDYIHAGDIFQANISQRFTAFGKPGPLDLYRRLRARSPAPYSAFLDLGSSRAVISSSPELFFETVGKRILTRPIKGTRPRGATPEEDRRNMAELVASAKDRAELAMIVDLLRNDLGRICEYGSVRVVEPSVVEQYATVFHQVATVEGRCRGNPMIATLLRAIFPGGSITGAPKIRAMEIIDELEPTRRGVYTGAIGYFSACAPNPLNIGRSAFNIAIRTMLVDRDRVSYQVGGGIVADSDPQLEYEETMHKGRAMRDVLEGRA